MAAGILDGTALSGPMAQAVEQIIVQRTVQSMYIDGQSVAFEAYNINGANYVKLRDIGEAVGFEVYWDGTSVQMKTAASQRISRLRMEAAFLVKPEAGLAPTACWQ